MNKRILDYSYESPRILHSFYSNVDFKTQKNHQTYDIIICNRDNIQNKNEFNDILNYVNGDTKILVDIIQESGGLDNFIDYFNTISKEHINIKFYLLVDSEFDFIFSSNVISLQSYKLSFLPFFENFCMSEHDSQLILNDLSIYNKEMGVLSLNGSIRTHRILLLNELLNRGFNIDSHDHYVSFLLYNNDFFDSDFYESFIKTMLNDNLLSNTEYLTLLSIKNKLPIKIPNETDGRPNLELNHCYKKIINLVTENTAGYDGTDNSKYKTITFTEKAWKPFKTHQLPLYISLNGYVDIIRNLGFDVFDDFINHRYDTEIDHKKRLGMVLDELEKISKLDCLDFYKKNYIRFAKNYSNIYKLKAEAYLELQSFIYDNELI